MQQNQGIGGSVIIVADKIVACVDDHLSNAVYN